MAKRRPKLITVEVVLRTGPNRKVRIPNEIGTFTQFLEAVRKAAPDLADVEIVGVLLDGRWIA